MSNAASRPRAERSSARRESILSDAAQAIVENGIASTSMDRLAKQAGVSKSLIYYHFSTLAQLLNEIVAREVEAIDAVSRLKGRNLEEDLVAAAWAYLERILDQGPILQSLFSDHSVEAGLDAGLRTQLNAVLRRLARHVRSYCGLSHREALVATTMLMSIPEQAGRLVREGRLEAPMARAMCAIHVRHALYALRDHLREIDDWAQLVKEPDAA